MPKRESRLKFTDEERMDPDLETAVKKAEKAADKAERARKKIPTSKTIKSEMRTEPATGKIKVKLSFEETQKKPPSKLSFAAQEAPGRLVKNQAHQELEEAEEDNVGIEAASQLEGTAENIRYLLHEGHHSHQLQPYRTAAKAEAHSDRANIEFLQKKAEKESPTSNPVSKWMQKQNIKRQYAAAKSGKATESIQTTAEGASKAAEKVEKTVEWVWNHKKGIAVIAGIMLMLAFLLNAMSSCSMFVESIGGAIVSSSYHASDGAIEGTEAAYCSKEQALQQKLDNYERTHDYDEYHYDLDDIGHDPYVLTSILSALHPGDWSLAEVGGTLNMLFEKQYILTETVDSEIRYRTEAGTDERHARDPQTGQYLYDVYGNPVMEEYEYEAGDPYTYYICYVKLENFDLSHVPVYIMTEEQLSRYAVFMSTLGNRPDLFPGSEYVSKREEGYIDYDIPPEALENEEFAGMIAEAEKYLGYPYVWGGSSPSTSFDCSGFVSWVINHSGWNVGRLSAQGLFNICTPVSSANVQPGDLVFFKGTYDTPGISHVGIYAGNSMMIHCGDPISYTNLNSNYWQSHFYSYGRLP